MVDAWQLESWEAYRDVARLGRKTRLPEKQRRALWSIFERVRASLAERSSSPRRSCSAGSPPASSEDEKAPLRLRGGRRGPGRERGPAALPRRARAAAGPTRSSSPATSGSASSSSRSPGERSASTSAVARATLRINYRTSHQIRTQADRLLGQADHRRRRQHRGAARHHLGLQRAGARAARGRLRRGRVRRGRRAGWRSGPPRASRRTRSPSSSAPRRSLPGPGPRSRPPGSSRPLLDDEVDDRARPRVGRHHAPGKGWSSGRWP